MISLVNKRNVYYYTTKNSGFQEVFGAEENFVGLYIILRTVEKSFSNIRTFEDVQRSKKQGRQVTSLLSAMH